MPNKSENLLKSTLIRNLPPSKSATSASRYLPSIANLQRVTQQARFVQSSRSNGSRRLTKDSIRVVSEVSLITPEFHSWQNDYQPIYTRTKLLKPMTKDPYLQHKLRLTTAVESNATKEECFPKLISPSEVRISKPIIQRAPMPSIEIPEAKVKPIIVTTNITKNQSTTPVFATDARLLNRAKMQNQNLIIRRPPRKLMINITHETMLPLAVCG